MDLKVPKKYDPTVARRFESPGSEKSYSESLVDEEEKEPSVPLSQHISLQQKFQLLSQEFELYKETSENSKLFDENCINILNQNITEYKQKVDDLLAKDEINMKYISALEKAVLEYQKATGKRIPVELPTDTSFKQLMKMSYNSRLTSIKLEYDQKIEESDRKYRTDIKIYREKISELMKLLKEERSRTTTAMELVSHLSQKLESPPIEDTSKIEDLTSKIEDLTSKLQTLMEKYKTLYSAYEELSKSQFNENTEVHTPSFKKDRKSSEYRMF